jgi:hypothetical protein
MIEIFYVLYPSTFYNILYQQSMIVQFIKVILFGQHFSGIVIVSGMFLNKK